MSVWGTGYSSLSLAGGGSPLNNNFEQLLIHWHYHYMNGNGNYIYANGNDNGNSTPLNNNFAQVAIHLLGACLVLTLHFISKVTLSVTF